MPDAAFQGTGLQSTGLEVTGLVAGYRPDLPILHSVALKAAAGQVTVIIGPNGAGKSTLIKAIAGLVPVQAGEIRHRGQTLDGIRPDEMAAHGIAYVPQTDNIFRSLTVRQNLALSLRRREDPSRGLAELTTRFPLLADKLGTKAGALSGGQRQVLALAMALATGPATLLLDEPSAGLSPKVAGEVLGLVRELAATGVTVVLVEQNVAQALKLADHCYILAEGQNQIDGKAEALLGDRVIADIYLGGRRMRAQR